MSVGPIIDYGLVETALLDLILEWIDSYLVLVERRNGLEPRDIARPKTWRVDDDVRRLPEDNLPLLTVVSAGELQEPSVNADGRVDGLLQVGIAAVVKDAYRDETRLMARRYSAAIATLIDDKAGRIGDGLATLAGKPTQRFDELRNTAKQHLGVAYVVFPVLVTGIRDHNHTGPDEPAEPAPADPPTYPPVPIAEQITVTVESLES